MTPPKTYAVTYAGRPEQVSRVRWLVAELLDGCPVACDAVLLASEIATNAVCHSNSRESGGTFIVRVVIHENCVRIEVEDQGGQWKPEDARIDGRGHGLDLVREIASDWAVDGSAKGRVVSFRLGWA
jgi:anti-sigma regulatory factor (Ser/Thr protein kinase)